jgi:O-antigen/teichoic acid export membrane protein
METRKNIFYNVILALSQVLFPLITFPYLARTLGPQHVGVINFAESFARNFIAIAAVGIPIYGVREIAKVAHNKEQRSKLFYEIFFINLISTLILSIVFFFCIVNFEKINTEKTLFIYTLLFFVLNIFHLEWFFAGLNQFKFVAIRFFIVRLFLVLVVFSFIKSSSDYLIYMKMQVGLSVLISLINFYFLRNIIVFNKNVFTNLNLKKHLKPLLILFLTLFSISIYLNLDTVVLGFLSNNESVGYYSSALKFNKLIISVLAAISAAMFPKLVSLYNNGEIDQFIKMITSGFYILLSLSIPAIVIVSGCANEIILLLFGEAFERAVLPLQISSPIILVVSMSTIFGFQILSALSKDKAILISAVIGMSISLILSYPLVTRYKENGEALVILITEIAVCFSFIYFTKKFYSIKNYSKIFFEHLLASIPYLLILVVFKSIVDNPFIRLISICSVSLLWFITFHFVILKDSIFKKELVKMILSKAKED